MSVENFDNGYWYARVLREFARFIGKRGASALRRTNSKLGSDTPQLTDRSAGLNSKLPGEVGPRDVDTGLAPIFRLTTNPSNAVTKALVLKEAPKIAPDIRKKPGVSYRLNRWREEQLATGRATTYEDLVREFVSLNDLDVFEKVPHGRFVNMARGSFLVELRPGFPIFKGHGAPIRRLLRRRQELQQKTILNPYFDQLERTPVASAGQPADIGAQTDDFALRQWRRKRAMRGGTVGWVGRLTGGEREGADLDFHSIRVDFYCRAAGVAEQNDASTGDGVEGVVTPAHQSRQDG